VTGRILAAVSYLGLAGALTPLARPETPFVVRHARQALLLHLLRFALIAPVVALPLLHRQGGGADAALLDVAVNLSLLGLLGIPPVQIDSNLSVLVGIVLTFTWAIDIFGALLALTGMTADWHAFFHADWPNYDVEKRRFWSSDASKHHPQIAREKERFTRLRDARLARMRGADTVAAQERRRRDSLEGLQEEFAAAAARKAHLTQLLQLGEISERRYSEQRGQLDARLAELGVRIAVHGARRLPPSELNGRRRHEPATDVLTQVPLQTLAITARSGVPLLTYGNFRLDEALVTGILSAFNSLSEEVFGAEVHKTELAEGQVLSFVHARHTVTMAVFEEDPSPTQLRLLRDLVDEFERINGQELAKSSPNPARLKEVAIPFSFVAATVTP
jgi:hypothetical protein